MSDGWQQQWGYDSDEGARDETVRSWVGVEQHSVSQMTLGGLQKSNGFRPFRWTCELLNEKIKALSKSMFFCFSFFVFLQSCTDILPTPAGRHKTLLSGEKKATALLSWLLPGGVQLH